MRVEFIYAATGAEELIWTIPSGCEKRIYGLRIGKMQNTLGTEHYIASHNLGVQNLQGTWLPMTGKHLLYVIMGNIL